MKILVLGSDGYIGYPLTIHLLNKGHKVFCIDNMSRRHRVKKIGSESLTPIAPPTSRRFYLTSFSGYEGYVEMNIADDPNFTRRILAEVKPECIIHLAEQPSAPWSMIDAYTAAKTQHENVIGNLNLLWAMKEECPDAHLIKIGTMGEYGTPSCDIPEGRIPEICLGTPEDQKEYRVSRCPMSGLLFPRQPGSFYHLSKVHDTYNVKFACDIWGLRSTDIMQGILFGVKVTGEESETELTRFDYDQYFGTVINRFCTQVLCEHPLTIYGDGTQTRGYLPLKDSIQCLTIAVENPPEKGKYRTWNQFENIYSINKLAVMVMGAGMKMGFSITSESIPNPRIEAEEGHYYNPHHQTLFDLGYKPTVDIQQEMANLLADLAPYKNRIIEDVIMPTTTWR